MKKPLYITVHELLNEEKFPVINVSLFICWAISLAASFAIPVVSIVGYISTGADFFSNEYLVRSCHIWVVLLPTLIIESLYQAGEQLKQYKKEHGEYPEWYQNKLDAQKMEVYDPTIYRENALR